jgi:ketosteroid isomerase-like protein
MFRFRKKFGLKEALKALRAKFDMSREGATTGKAFLAALGIKVTVVSEAEKKITEVKASQKAAKDDIAVATTSLDDIAKECETTMETLTSDSEAAVEAIETAADGKIFKIEGKRDKKVARLGDKIEEERNKAKSKLEQVFDKAFVTKQAALNKTEVKMVETVRKTAESVTSVGIMINDLKTEIKNQNVFLSNLEKIKKLFA